MKERLYLFDTTLRDGAQTPGVDFSLEDKRMVARCSTRWASTMSRAGIRANPTDTAFFEARHCFGEVHRVRHDQACRAARRTIPAFSRPGCVGRRCLPRRQDLGSPCRGRAWVRRGENLENRRLDGGGAGRGREPLIDCEHFFDGYKVNPDLRAGLREGRLRGRRPLGCALRHQWRHPAARGRGERRRVVRHIPRRSDRHPRAQRYGVGGRQLAGGGAGRRAAVQGTLNGLGERCGNANLIRIIPTLILKADYATRFETRIGARRLHAHRLFPPFDDLLNRELNRHAPYVGESAFATKAASMLPLAQGAATYEHVPPESVDKTLGLVSNQAGRSNILAELARIGMRWTRTIRGSRPPGAGKDGEAHGYSYDGADASFELLARRAFGDVPEFFNVESFRSRSSGATTCGGNRSRSRRPS